MSDGNKTPGMRRRRLQADHFREILAATQPIGFFEVHAENYLGAGGPPHAQLRALRERYALSVHGVGLSIGATEPLDLDHLSRLSFVRSLRAGELLGASCLVIIRRRLFNDLLPLPYTEQTLTCGRRTY